MIESQSTTDWDLSQTHQDNSMETASANKSRNLHLKSLLKTGKSRSSTVRLQRPLPCQATRDRCSESSFDNPAKRTHRLALNTAPVRQPMARANATFLQWSMSHLIETPLIIKRSFPGLSRCFNNWIHIAQHASLVCCPRRTSCLSCLKQPCTSSVLLCTTGFLHRSHLSKVFSWWGLQFFS